jgi:hypothetical protein
VKSKRPAERNPTQLSEVLPLLSEIDNLLKPQTGIGKPKTSLTKDNLKRITTRISENFISFYSQHFLYF